MNLGVATEPVQALLGSAIPFAKTKAEREKAGDPRLRLEERYATREAYLAKASGVAQALVNAGFLLQEDASTAAARVGAYWPH